MCFTEACSTAIRPGINSPRVRRRGATLLELLTVIVVLMMITSATIPVVAPHAEGRRLREGGRMLSTFINAGRTRAIETGRPAGVWIERMSNLPEASNMVYLAEIPQLYSGDFLDSTAECFVVGKVTGTTTWPNQEDQEYYNIVVPRNRTAYQTDIWANPDPSTHQLVRERDLIKFEGIDRYYNLNIINDYGVPNSNQRSWWYIAKGNNASTAAGDYDNDVDLHLRYHIRWFSGPTGSSISDGTVLRTTLKPFTFSHPGLRYQIYRQPVRLQAGSIRMPEGVVIDLNFSSVTNGEAADAGVPFHPRNGNNLFIGDAYYPEDNTPVVFVFTPDGRVQRLYRQREDTGGRWSWDVTEPYGNIYLLVGERNSVVPHESAANVAQQLKKNWVNLNALWVRVDCMTGFTTSGLVDMLQSTSYVTDVKKYLPTTRAKARGAKTIGGR